VYVLNASFPVRSAGSRFLFDTFALGTIGWRRFQSMIVPFPLIAALALIVSIPAAAGGETSSQPAPSTAKPAESSSRGRPALPEHERMLLLQFEWKDKALSLAKRSEADGRVKPAPAPEGRTGVYFRALDNTGALICDGMLPDPFLIRVPPGTPPAGSSSRAPSHPKRDETTFLVRLPSVASLHSLELYRVPQGTAPGAPRDAAEFQLGTFGLAKK
jgi:hypothetical protein